ncbi:MAG: hypothetical protein ABMA64_08820 [Myxococcota bacterium]
MEGPVEQILGVVSAWVPGAGRAAVTGAGEVAELTALGRALDGLSPGPSTQAADATLRALVLAAWARRLGGVTAFARCPGGPLVASAWAAIDVVMPLGPVSVARVTRPHLEPQSRKLAAVGGPGWDEHGWGELAPWLQDRVNAAAGVGDAVAREVTAVLVGPDGRLRHRPSQLVSYEQYARVLVGQGVAAGR